MASVGNIRLFWVLLLPLCIAFCSDSGNPSSVSLYKTVNAFPQVSFTRPVDLQYSPDNTNRIFVVEQAGVINVFNNDSDTPDKKIFLDIKSKIDDSGNEEGLLGLAFHPDYKTNGYFYVNYTASDPERTVISRFKVSANADQADAGSELVLLTFNQPYSNHNGGQISFGPDGYLYIAVGDGGSGGDPHNHGQDRTTLLGSILRIDVNKEEDGNHYAIPPDNPFANNASGFKEEIYAYGLRNPWRFSFDHQDGTLWAADVGQNSFEEIDIIVNGGNYGWNIMEGTHCFEPRVGCNKNDLVLPVYEYGRSQGVSITGGFVYRGPTLDQLQGKYIYADYGSRKIWALDITNITKPINTTLLTADFHIASFGVDQNQELYICGFDGKIYKLTD